MKKWLLVLLTNLVACAGGSPTSDSPCPPGHVRDGGDRCRALCNSSEECPPCESCLEGMCYAGNDCQDGACRDVDDCPVVACQTVACVNNLCVATADGTTAPCSDQDRCTTDDACDGAGHCVGTPMVCDDPPANSCDDNDEFFLSYPDLGECVDDGAAASCVYVPTQYDCDGECAATCLAPCETLPCDEPAVGCLAAGHCKPGPSPSCEYPQKPETAPCLVTGDVEGVCLSGVCTDCRHPGECTQPPSGTLACYTPTCTGGGCDYPTAAAGAPCSASTCTGSSFTPGGTCDGSGTCVPGTPAPCANGYACDDDGITCRTSCSDHADCSSTHYCNGTSCTPRIAQGATGCSNGFECIGGHCECGDATCSTVGQRCTNVDCPVCHYATNGTSCIGSISPPGTDAPGCAGGSSCFSGSCKLDNNQPCSINSDCGNTCIAGSCNNRSNAGGACDTAGVVSEREGDCSSASGMRCAAGTCQSCTWGATDCGDNGTCESLTVDPNCGSCYRDCVGNKVSCDYITDVGYCCVDDDEPGVCCPDCEISP